MLTAVIIGCSTSNQPLKTPGGTCGFKSTSQYVPGYVPARSETEAKTFCSIYFALLNLLPTPRSTAFFMGNKKTKKQADLMLLYTLITKIIMSQLHVLTRSLWGTNKMIVSKQVHVLARSLSGLNV